VERADGGRIFQLRAHQGFVFTFTQDAGVDGFQLRVSLQAAISSLQITLKAACVAVAAGGNIRVRALPVARLNGVQHGLHRAPGRRCRRRAAFVYRSGSDQRHGKNSEGERKKVFHDTSLRTGSEAMRVAGNVTASAKRRLSGNTNTKISPRMLVPMGSVPHRIPSSAVGGVPK